MVNIKPDVKDTVKGFTKEYVSEVVRESTKKLLKRLTKDKRIELEAKLKNATVEELKHYLNSNPELKAALNKTIGSVKEASLKNVQAAYEENFSKIFTQPAPPVPAKGVVTIKIHTLIICLAFVAMLSVAAALYFNPPWPSPSPSVTPTIPSPDDLSNGETPALKAPSPDDGVEGWSKVNTLTFTWDPPESQGGIKGYNYKLEDGSESYVTSTSVTLNSLPDGTGTFYVNAMDNSDNVSQWGSHDFKIDTEAPEGKIVINNGDESTQSPDVTLTVRYEDAGSGVKAVRFSNSENFTDGWEDPPEGNEKAWKLSDDTVGLGHDQAKTVYYQIKDEVGHVSQVYSAQITLLQAPTESPAPTVVSVSPTGNAVSLMPTITVKFSESMDKSSVESAFSTTPKIEGEFGWSDDTTMTFTPLEGLPESAKYIVTIDTGAKSSENKNLELPYRWGFSTTIG